MNKKRLFRWIKVFLLLYGLTGIAIYYLQDNLFLHPEPLPKSHVFNFEQPFREVNLPYTDDSNINLVQFTTKDTTPKGVVLYFHGNKKNITHYAQYAPNFTKEGYEVWMMDYPGYGKSTGEFSEEMLYDWALAIYTLARARYTPKEIILYGKSLGTGIAAQLAAIRNCKHLILETPYYSFPSAVNAYAPIFPMNNMIKLKFPIYKYLPEVTDPVTIFHGKSDGVILHRNSSRLKPLLKANDAFISIEGGSHNDLSSYAEYKNKLSFILQEL